MHHTRVLPLCLLMAACGHWPPDAAGGVAETAPPRAAAVLADPALASHLECSLANVAALAQVSEQSGRASGQVEHLGQMAARAQREAGGNLPKDAVQSLVLLDNRVAALTPGLLTHGLVTRQCTG